MMRTQNRVHFVQNYIWKTTELMFFLKKMFRTPIYIFYFEFEIMWIMVEEIQEEESDLIFINLCCLG